MFTGIVTAIGYIKTVTPIGTPQTGVRLHIDSGTLDMQDVQRGDSIAIQGACMTVVAQGHQHFDVEVSQNRCASPKDWLPLDLSILKKPCAYLIDSAGILSQATSMAAAQCRTLHKSVSHGIYAFKPL